MQQGFDPHDHHGVAVTGSSWSLPATPLHACARAIAALSPASAASLGTHPDPGPDRLGNYSALAMPSGAGDLVRKLIDDHDPAG